MSARLTRARAIYGYFSKDVRKRRGRLLGGIGFAVLYAGPQIKDLKSESAARQKATGAARDAAANAKREHFALGTIIFLDVEEGGRLPATYEVVYGHAWKPEPRFAADGRAIVRLQRDVRAR